MAQTQAKVRMSRGKFEGINAVANEQGIINAAAMDQRGSLQRALGKAEGSAASDDELSEFKALVTEILTPYASAILLDPEYGLEAAKRRAPGTGLFLAYEQSGYDTTTKVVYRTSCPNGLFGAWLLLALTRSRSCSTTIQMTIRRSTPSSTPSCSGLALNAAPMTFLSS